ncbi:MAG: TPM domain-containing protein [Candidatus Ancillula sp.]|jgi:hypothetical protein|nr:TPM domain-containing protein [Candidatus Ancillula sp.]
MPKNFAPQLIKKTFALVLVALFCCCYFVKINCVARADQPVKMTTQVVDDKNALGDIKIQLLDKINEVKKSTGINVWMVFVPTFNLPSEDLNNDGKVDTNDWVKDTAQKSGLGANDILFAVATTAHDMGVYVPDNSKFSKRDLEAISNSVMVYLRDGDWGNAALTFCSSAQNQANAGNSTLVYVFVLLLIVALIIFLAYSSLNHGLSPEEVKYKRQLKRAQRENRVSLRDRKNARKVEAAVGSVGAADVLGDAIKQLDSNAKSSKILRGFGFRSSESIKRSNAITDEIPTVREQVNQAFDSNSNNSEELFVPNNSSRDIYGDYYKRSSLREVYGSYYYSDDNAKHDAQLNHQQDLEEEKQTGIQASQQKINVPQPWEVKDKKHKLNISKYLKK